MSVPLRILKLVCDMMVLAVCAPLFFLVFPALCLPWLAGNALLGRSLPMAMQAFCHGFFRLFFGLAVGIAPGVRLSLDPALRRTRGCVVVCNHISYLDPLLLVSLLPRFTTLVKPTWVRTPVFGWFMRRLGLIPAEGGAGLLDEGRVRQLGEFLRAGGNLFVFPEGRRSRDGRLQPFHKGAFTIARLCAAPLRAWRVRGSARFFPPGAYWFQTFSGAELRVEEIGAFTPDYQALSFSIPAFTHEVEALYREPGG